MYDREEDNRKMEEGRIVQQELERQLRAFGSTMSDAVNHGFEGRGIEIGDRAFDVGKAAVHAAGYGVDRAFNASQTKKNASNTYRQRSARNYAAPPAWNEPKPAQQTDPVRVIRTSAGKRHNAGIVRLVSGCICALLFGAAGIACLFYAGVVNPTAADASGLLYLIASGLANLLSGALQGAGVILSGAALGFCLLIASAVPHLKAGKQLNLLADAADGLDAKHGLQLDMVADLLGKTQGKTVKLLRKFVHKNWLQIWLDEAAGRIYLNAEDYRAAQQQQQEQAAAEQQSHKQAQTQATAAAGEVHANLETARRFAAVLRQQKQLMQDEQASDELEHMCKTTSAICDWLESHPESMPKVRRFAEYYIPTTLKLLHTYNDVQGQQGDNAEAIRRDIAGILHTLNQAYDTLYNNLLSDMAMDVSSEIAALQGMLANDGLTGGDFQ